MSTSFCWFIRNEKETDFEGKSWADLLDVWLRMIPDDEQFKTVDGMIVTLMDMPAKDYLESDPLDLDHLSTRGG
jgi:hypothetical protein